MSSKSVFSTKPGVSPLIAELACFNLALNFSAVTLLNFGVVTYLLWPGIFISTAVRAVAGATLLLLVTLFLTLFFQQ